MDRDTKDIGIIIENVLSPVPMVHIGIDNGYFLDAVFGPQVVDQDRFIIQRTKTAVTPDRSAGVMAGRLTRAKPLFISLSISAFPSTRELPTAIR